jgi:hypothetical protein
MTPDEHNKYVGIANVAYGAFHILVMLLMGVIFAAMVGMMTLNGGRSNGPPPAFIGIIIVFAVVVNLVMAVPSFIAGYAFLKRKPWAKVAGIIAAVMSALRIPFGTLVSIYTFWFLFSEPGKTLYDRQSQALPPAPPVDWTDIGEQKRRENQYAPPASPPDWR